MNVIEIKRRGGKCDFVLVDDCDYTAMNAYKWHITCRDEGRTEYARCHIADDTGKRKPVRMHSLIMACPSGYEVDHKNGNGLDNRRANLRIVSHAENMKNTHRKSKHNKPRKTKCEAVQQVQQVQQMPEINVENQIEKVEKIDLDKIREMLRARFSKNKGAQI